MDNESQDIFQTSLIDRYAGRPDSLNNLCLVEFAANYATQRGREFPDGETSDAVSPPEDDDSRKCERIQLKTVAEYLAGWQLHVPCRLSSKHFHFR